MLTTTILAIAQALLIFTLGYQTAKLVRRYQDEQFMDDLHSRICQKILETELMKKEILDNIVIINEEEVK